MLFIIKSGDKDCCRKILRYMEEGDKVVLIQDGVLLLHNKENEFIKSFVEKKTEILFLKDDLDLRGINNKVEAKGITPGEMIELMENNKVFS